MSKRQETGSTAKAGEESNSGINLEKLLLIEDKIWTILEIHRFLEKVVRSGAQNGISRQSAARHDAQEEFKHDSGSLA